MVAETEIIDIIRKYAPCFNDKIMIAIGDDTAFLTNHFTKESYILLTTDQLVEGVHFSWEWSTPSDVAYKLVQMNLSDIFAKGGRPSFALLNCQLSKNFVKTSNKITSFAKELGRLFKKYHITLLGGDTTASGIDSFSLTLLGECSSLFPRISPQVEAEDVLLLFGDLGGSSYALSKLSQKEKITNRVQKFYTRPEAKAEVVPILNKLEVKASMDVSDSLYESIDIFSRSNHAHIVVDLDKIAYPRELKKLEDDQRIPHILGGGEDFSVLFVVPKRLKEKTEKMSKTNRLLRIIGKFASVGKKRLIEYYSNGKKIEPDIKGFRHFS